MQDWYWVLRGGDLIKFKWEQKQGPMGQREKENKNL